MADQGPDWSIKGADGGVLVVERALLDDAVCVETEADGARLDLPRLRALIAELTRRAALLAGEAGEEPVRMQLRDVPAGSIFETETGIRAVKTEYHYPNGGIKCVLLASGEYAHFGGEGGVAAHNSTWVRLLSVDVPARTAEDERADVVAELVRLREEAAAYGLPAAHKAYHMAAMVWAAAFAQSAVGGYDGAVCAEIADDAEARYRAEDAARWERREREEGGK